MQHENDAKPLHSRPAGEKHKQTGHGRSRAQTLAPRKFSNAVKHCPARQIAQTLEPREPSPEQSQLQKPQQTYAHENTPGQA